MPAAHLRNKNIDRTRWDAAVARDPSCLPYGLSWWLDMVTDGRWDGIVLDDYRAVLPLPRSRSFGRFTRVQRADFTQQGGPFGELLPGDVEAMLSALPRSVLSFRLPLREQLLVKQASLPARTHSRHNYVLSLTQSLGDIRKGYNRSLKRQLKNQPISTLRPTSIEEVIELYRNSVGPKVGLKPLHYRRVQRLAEAALCRSKGYCYRLEDEQNGLLAAGFFPSHRGRLINLFAASSPAGYEQHGMARLLDALIDRHHGDHRILDFEGSDIEGIANFFRSFGPELIPYLSTE